MKKLAATLAIIGHEVETLGDYDQLQAHVHKHAGEVGKVELVKISNTQLTGLEPNVNATTIIFGLIKAIQDAEETGQLTFSVKFIKGRASLLQVQDFKEIK